MQRLCSSAAPPLPAPRNVDPAERQTPPSKHMRHGSLARRPGPGSDNEATTGLEVSAFWRCPNSPSSGTSESRNYKQQTHKLLTQSRIRTVNYCCRAHIPCILTPPLIESSTSRQTRAHWRCVPAPRLGCLLTPTFDASRASAMANVAFVGQIEEADFPNKRLAAPAPGFARPCLTPHNPGFHTSVWSSATHKFLSFVFEKVKIFPSISLRATENSLFMCNYIIYNPTRSWNEFPGDEERV